MVKYFTDASHMSEFAKALGIEDPENVRRILIDVESGEMPRVLVERFADTDTTINAMRALIEKESIDE